MISKFKWHLITLAAFIVTIFLTRFGFEDSDTGFIVGLGWRALNGEIPYLDYSYVRPPISIIHSYLIMLFFPEDYQFLISRIFSSILLISSVLLFITAVDNQYELKEYKIKIILCSFLLSQYCLSTMMLWHTIDGIFYASLGVYFTSLFSKKRNITYLILATVSFCLSVLAKQNFLAPLMLFILLSIVIHKKKSLYAVMASVIFFLCVHYIFEVIGVSSKFYSSISGKTQLIDILNSSVFPYINWISSKYFLALALLSLIFTFFLKKFTKKSKDIYILSLPILGSFLFVIFYKFGAVDPIRLFRLDHFIPFIIASNFIFIFIKSKEKTNLINKYQLLILGLSISWCAGVSWGFNSPLLFSAPIIAYFFIIKNKVDKRLVNVMLLVSFIYTFKILTPYRNPTIDELSYDMGDISNKSSGILASRETLEKYRELANLNNKYDLDTSTVFPSMPLAHYLFNKNNPYYIDWAMDIESNLSKIESINIINSCCTYVFIEKKRVGHPIGFPGTRFYSSISDYVLSEWKLIEELDYFSVYTKKPIDNHVLN